MTTAHGSVDGSCILVVGGLRSALGSAVAAGLRARGAQVVVTGREIGSSEEAVRLDVTDAREVADAIGEAAARLGRLDAVVNASGITAQTPSLELQLGEWERILAVNLTGSFLVAQAAAKVMRGQTADRGSRGSIVLVASLCAAVGCDSVAAYAASKAGVLGLSRTLASEFGPLGIRVNALIPGVFPTALNRDRIMGEPRGDNSLVRTPLGRFGEPDELVGAVAYLAGGDASFVTGAELVVDGGFLASGITGRTLSGRDALSEGQP